MSDICPLCQEPIDPQERQVVVVRRIERVNRGGYRIMINEERLAHYTCPVWQGKKVEPPAGQS
jgi:hypothetical protein